MTSAKISRDVVEDVRASCEKTGRPTTAAEVMRMLSTLESDEQDAVRRLARATPPARPLGPDALVEIVRGVAPELAAARELSGYYTLKAERDALATLVTARDEAGDDEESDDSDEDSDSDWSADSDSESDDDSYDADDADDDGTVSDDDDEVETFETSRRAPARPANARPANIDPPDALAGERIRLRKPRNPVERPVETERLLTLFAYHRDAVLVAQAMNLGLSDLNDMVESLGLRRKINTLLERTTDIDLFSPDRIKLVRSSAQDAPVVRRRGEKATSAVTSSSLISEPVPFNAGPAARTEPVNAYGTRVYRRPDAGPAPRPAPSTVAPGAMREYVREVRRKPKSNEAKTAGPRGDDQAATETPALQPFSDLQDHGGHAILERLLADEKANPRVLAAKLAERFNGPGRTINESDLRQLMTYHGLAETFRERELANTRFLMGFHQGARTKLANGLQMTADELATYLARLGITDELERLRAERAKLELSRKKLSERLTQVLTRAPYLDDLGVLPTIDREVREQLEQLAKQATTHDAPSEWMREQLGVEPNAFAKLLRRYELPAP